MQIILLESIDRVGKAGEIVAVKDGYANNYLIPRKLAIVANKNNKLELQSKIDVISERNKQKIEEANALKLELDKISLTMRVEANDEGGLYGTITQKQISDLLKAEGHSILNENIITGEIKVLGEFEITIKIYEDISSILKVSVEKR
ncbi:MAG: 50S ribosomal protein L9 [Candidatus Pelagibacterales bacterium]|jgi:large subunit ribosomal protein L9|tara:strand:+ start:130 stop:570 length:441 start_codon:yes stop_codon:yes gene_type:complete